MQLNRPGAFIVHPAQVLGSHWGATHQLAEAESDHLSELVAIAKSVELSAKRAPRDATLTLGEPLKLVYTSSRMVTMILSKTYLSNSHSKTCLILASERCITDRDEPEFWGLKLLEEQEEGASLHPTANLIYSQNIGNGRRMIVSLQGLDIYSYVLTCLDEPTQSA